MISVVFNGWLVVEVLGVVRQDDDQCSFQWCCIFVFVLLFSYIQRAIINCSSPLMYNSE